MKKLLCLLFAAFLLCVSASALELPSGLDDVVPRELIDSAEAGDDLLLRGGQYLFSHFRAALQDAVANSLRGAMTLMLLSLLCGLVEGTAESAGETPARYTGYLGVLSAAALSAGDQKEVLPLSEPAHLHILTEALPVPDSHHWPHHIMHRQYHQKLSFYLLLYLR